MFKYENVEVTDVYTISDLWKKYINVPEWPLWDPSLTHASLNGSFEVGSKGLMGIIDMAPLEFTLIEVIPFTSFTNESNMGPFNVRFTHEITSENGLSRVKHGLVVTGPNHEKVQEIGNNISKTISPAMKNLIVKNHE